MLAHEQKGAHLHELTSEYYLTLIFIISPANIDFHPWWSLSLMDTMDPNQRGCGTWDLAIS